MFNSPRPAEEPRVENEEEDYSEFKREPGGGVDITFCHRMTICFPGIRDMLVTRPVSKYLCRRLTWAKMFQLATCVGIVLMIWTILYFLLGDTMVPRNQGFSLYFLVIFSYWLGWGLTFIPYLHLPPAFGMVLAGLIVRNTGLYDIYEGLGIKTIAKIRIFCLTFVMIRAGLQLSTTSLKSYPFLMLSLALLPCSVEMIIFSGCCKFILDYPWDWSFMAGAVMCSTSPVVIVNCVLALAEKGYGEDKGIPTILCTAACIDVVHMVSLFAVCYSMIFTKDIDKTEWWSYIPGGFRDLILGTIVGTLLGTFFVFFPHRSHKYVTWYRMIGLILASLMCTTATARLTISGGGLLACVVLSFIASSGWRILSGTYDNTIPFRQATFFLWTLVQAVLIGVIGAEISFADWSLARFGLHLTLISIGLMARSVVTILTTLRSPLNWKERLFVVACWLTKGTMQAALGPMAVDRAQNEKDPRQIELAMDVLKMSAVTVFFLAPLGAYLVSHSGPLLLNRITAEEIERERQLSYLRNLSLEPFRSNGKGGDPKKLRENA